MLSKKNERMRRFSSYTHRSIVSILENNTLLVDFAQLNLEGL